ncbi:hypothetical protein CL653_03255 [bacterium]|nr:hypothetical protein [bacterium]
MYYPHTGERYCDLPADEQELVVALNMAKTKMLPVNDALENGIALLDDGESYPHVESGVVISFPITQFQFEMLKVAPYFSLDCISIAEFFEEDKYVCMLKQVHPYGILHNSHSFLFGNDQNVQPLIKRVSRLIKQYYVELEQAFRRDHPDLIEKMKKQYKT